MNFIVHLYLYCTVPALNANIRVFKWHVKSLKWHDSYTIAHACSYQSSGKLHKLTVFISVPDTRTFYQHSLPCTYWGVKKDRRKYTYEKLSLSFSFSVIIFRISVWWIRGSNTSKRGNFMIPWSPWPSFCIEGQCGDEQKHSLLGLSAPPPPPQSRCKGKCKFKNRRLESSC